MPAEVRVSKGLPVSDTFGALLALIGKPDSYKLKIVDINCDFIWKKKHGLEKKSMDWKKKHGLGPSKICEC